MKFVHIADVHFDMPFTTLDTKGLAQNRRIEQRNAFRKVINYIKENSIENLFICGDLYEHQYIRQSTIEYINKQFESIPDTKIYIIPGNHDPYIKNSYYANFKFSKNVKIFTSKIEKIEEGNINIYGYGFEDFYMQNKENEKLKIQNMNKINILLTHGDLDGTENKQTQYNPISKRFINSLGFDYVALGHIHKREWSDKIVYPGSLISLGFDEPGKHRYDYTEK